MNPQGQNPNYALIFIFVTILVDVIGIGIIIPVIPKLIENLTEEPLNIAASYGGLLMISFAFMQFLFSPILGEISDKYGRRPILLISLFGLGCDYLLHAFAPTITWLFVGRILAGITGASFTVATAYISDVSTKENKAKNFGLIGAAFGIGFIIGPVIGGVSAEIGGVKAPFFVASFITLLNFIFGFFFVPESLPRERRRKINYKKMTPFLSLYQLSQYKMFFGLIVAFFLANLASQVLPSIWSFYTMEMYQWEEKEIGYSLALIGLLVAIVQGGLIGVSVRKWGNKTVIIGGFLLWTIGMTLFAFSYNQWLLLIFLIPYVLGGVAGPTIQSLMSNEVSNQEQGNLQGALTSLVSLTSVIGPALYTFLFYKFSDVQKWYYFPGIPFLAGGFILLIGSIFAFSALKKNESWIKD